MDGILVVNKPQNYTSHDIVAKIRKELNIKKVGHTGTLDPLATGVLPILLGNATKISQYILNHNKEYIATIKFGIKTDTADITGNVIKSMPIKEIPLSEINNTLKKFIGPQTQVPPMYSAIKVNGKKLYEYARENKVVEVKPRQINIYSIDLIEYNVNYLKILVSCSKGTYIRTLCEDIAESLGLVGTLSALQRTKVGDFTLENSINFDEINTENVNKKIISIEDFFINKPKLNLDSEKLKYYLNGVMFTNILSDGLYRVYCNNKFIGIGVIKDNLLKREIVV